MLVNELKQIVIKDAIMRYYLMIVLLKKEKQ